MTDRPTLRVVHGRPTASELAALVVVLRAVQRRSTPPAVVSRSRWADSARALRGPLTPGPDAWLDSGRPR